MSDNKPYILLVCNDLFFGGKITGAQSSMHVVVDSAGSLQQLSDPQCVGVLLDMNHPSVTPTIARAAAREGQKLLAFGPHVRTELFEAAVAAGFETVTRGQIDRSTKDVLESFA